MLNLVIPMSPYPQPRPRHTRNGQTYVPQEAREARLLFQGHLLRLNRAALPLEGPLAVEIGLFRPEKRDRRKDGDGDNYEKFIFDAANGIIWADDRQVVECHWRIVESEIGRVELSVREAT